MKREDYIENYLKKDGINAFLSSRDVKLRIMIRDYLLENNYVLEYANKFAFCIDIDISDQFFKDRELLLEAIYSVERQIQAIVLYCESVELTEQMENFIKEQVKIIDLVYKNN